MQNELKKGLFAALDLCYPRVTAGRTTLSGSTLFPKGVVRVVRPKGLFEALFCAVSGLIFRWSDVAWRWCAGSSGIGTLSQLPFGKHEAVPLVEGASVCGRDRAPFNKEMSNNRASGYC